MKRGISKNALNLCDYVECRITCDKCKKVESGFGIDPIDIAVSLDEYKWRCTPSGKVFCKSCRRKKSRPTLHKVL